MGHFKIQKTLKFILLILLLQIIVVTQVIIALQLTNEAVWIGLGALSLLINVGTVMWFIRTLRTTHDNAIAQIKANLAQEQQAKDQRTKEQQAKDQQAKEQLDLRNKKGKYKNKAKNKTTDTAEPSPDLSQAYIHVGDNRHPGTAVAGVLGLVSFGAVIMLSQIITIGLIAFAAIGGGMAGYIAGYTWRGKQNLVLRSRETLLSNNQNVSEVEWTEGLQRIAPPIINIKATKAEPL